MKQILAALLLLTAVPMLNAQDKSGTTHYKAAEQMLTLLDMPTMLKQSVDQMVAAQIAQNPSLGQFESVFKDFLAKYMSWDSLKADMVKIYMDEFTEAELGELNKFYQTPVGRKTVEKMPTLMSKGAQIGSQRVQAHMPELQAAIAAKAQKDAPAGAAPAGAPATASSPSPAAKKK